MADRKKRGTVKPARPVGRTTGGGGSSRTSRPTQLQPIPEDLNQTTKVKKEKQQQEQQEKKKEKQRKTYNPPRIKVPIDLNPPSQHQK